MIEKQNRRLAVLNVFPFLIVPVLFYNLLALFSADPAPGSTVPALIATLRADAFTLPMLSGATLGLNWGDMLLLLAIIFLLVEVVKSTRTGSSSIINHMLSFGVFIVCVVEFLTLPSFASSTFFLLTMIVLLDAMAGMAVSIVSARRDFDVDGQPHG